MGFAFTHKKLYNNHLTHQIHKQHKFSQNKNTVRARVWESFALFFQVLFSHRRAHPQLCTLSLILGLSVSANLNNSHLFQTSSYLFQKNSDVVSAISHPISFHDSFFSFAIVFSTRHSSNFLLYYRGWSSEVVIDAFLGLFEDKNIAASRWRSGYVFVGMSSAQKRFRLSSIP